MLELFIRPAGQNGRFGVLLASAALAASGPAAAIGGLGGGQGGFWRPVHGLGRRGATATVARER
jgi:hypothetical protein